MSSEYEVHGPHDHEVEHAAHGAHRRDSLTGRIAVTTAILATLGALCAYQGGNAESLALFGLLLPMLNALRAIRIWPNSRPLPRPPLGRRSLRSLRRFLPIRSFFLSSQFVSFLLNLNANNWH